MNYIKLPDATIPNLSYDCNLVEVSTPKFNIGQKVVIIDSEYHPEEWEQVIILG
jgi:hypothetical protein